MSPAPRRLAATIGLCLCLCLALVASASARPPSGGPARAATATPTLLTGWNGRLRVRPSSIYYTGDGSGVLGVLRRRFGLSGPGRGSLRWSAWGATGAKGRGTVWIKLGSPTATSPFTRFAVSVTAGRVRSGRFTRMTLHYRLHGRPVSDVRCVPDAGPVSGWRVLFQGACG